VKAGIDIMKKLFVFVVIVAALGSAAWAYYAKRNRPEPTVTTMPVSRGNVIEVVQATGTLQAVTTVNVGTQVSGVVQDLFADFNNIVRKGQVIARLDPSILQVQIESQEANVARARADLERLQVTLVDAKQKFARAKELFDKQLVPRTELETAEITVKSTEAQIKSSQASLTQSQASLNQAKVNLGYTVITAPIDGIVIQRSVDPGQTVAASMNAPTLYVIAADLTQMQVLANIDESDVGRMRPGQRVTFRVDAYPNDTFTGTVWQVRLQPTVVQNVVVYSTVIAVPNEQLKLKPGMTANVNIEVQRRDNVLRVPTAAARFRPTELMFQALNQPVPPEIQRGAGRGNVAGGRNGGGRGNREGGGQGQPGGASGAPGGQSAPGTSPAPSGQSAAPGAQPAPQQAQAGQERGGRTAGGRPESAEARGGGDRANAAPPQQANRGDGGGRGQGGGGFDPNMTPEERQKRREERMASMSPEERERFLARMKEREAQGGGFGGGRGGQQPPEGQRALGRGADGGGRGGNQVMASRGLSRGMVGNVTAGASVASGAMTIDSLFAPLVPAESRGRLWFYENKQLRSVQVRLGISDSQFQEVLEGDIKEGQEVVVNMVTGLEPTTRPGQQQGTGNPLMGPQRGGPGGGGNRGGGGGRGF
jgi:HlyD family secretion protein